MTVECNNKLLMRNETSNNTIVSRPAPDYKCQSQIIITKTTPFWILIDYSVVRVRQSAHTYS